MTNIKDVLASRGRGKAPLQTVYHRGKTSRVWSTQSRDAAIIEVLLQTGIRLSELAGLTLTDVEIPQKISKEVENVGSVLIRRGRGRKDRVIALNYKSCRALRSYLQVRPRDTITLGLFSSGQ